MNFLEVINIASKFDAKGFKQAETALGKLASTTKKLAGAAGIAYGAAAITAYGKAAVKAFAQDEAAAVRLNRAVTNLGIGFANPAIADYIGKLEKSAGVADDILRPAFQSLLTTTGSLTKSQELLNNAITISRASGIDLATVSEDLAKGYVGITKGLSKYNTGLTRAELNSKSFSEILGVLLTRSAGAAEDYLTTTSYKMDVLSIATGNASEIIGEGLVQAFARIGGGTEVTDAQIAIEGIAKALSGITIATGTALGGITNVFRTLKNLPKNIFQGFAGVQGGVNFGSVAPTPTSTLSQQQQQKALKAMEAAAKKRAAELLATQKKTLKASQDQLKLAKAKAIFDLQKIQIEAALKGKISEEEKIRLLLLRAIAEENIEDIEKYTKMLNAIQGKVEQLQETLAEVYAMDAGNPFIEWEIGLDGVQRALIQINDQSIELTNTIAQNSLAMGLLGGASFAQSLSGARYAAQAAAKYGASATISGLPTITGATTTTTAPTTVVNVNIEGTVTSQQDLQQAIQDAISNAGISGNQVITGTLDRQVAI